MKQYSDSLVLVTGGNGFLARHTILRLLQRNIAVRASVRSEDKGSQLRTVLTEAGVKTDNLQTIVADLLAPQSWPPAMEGISHVMHLAAAMQGKTVRASALEGTRNILEASAGAGVERVAVTSTGLAALKPKLPAGPVDQRSEADWTDSEQPGLDDYTAAKTRAERDAWRQAERPGLSLTTILPGVIMGPVLGRERSLWQGLIGDMLYGKLPALPPMKLQVVDVRDVADLHIAALFAPEAHGQRYIAAGETFSLGEIAALIKHDLGAAASKVSTREMPAILFRLAALVSVQARSALPLLGASPHLDASKARRELGWTPRQSRTSLIDTARSLLTPEQ
jgi:dihydroflavonol-4-reductase